LTVMKRINSVIVNRVLRLEASARSVLTPGVTKATHRVGTKSGAMGTVHMSVVNLEAQTALERALKLVEAAPADIGMTDLEPARKTGVVLRGDLLANRSIEPVNSSLVRGESIRLVLPPAEPAVNFQVAVKGAITLGKIDLATRSQLLAATDLKPFRRPEPVANSSVSTIPLSAGTNPKQGAAQQVVQVRTMEIASPELQDLTP
jgi:hypothetical protein